MVKNDKGGHHKNRARKDNIVAPSKKLRLSEDPGEIYAIVVKMLGGSMCHVECIDGKKRLCHFRGKFSGKNKRQNEVSLYTWVMVGAREWESTAPAGGKLNQCDLIEIYTDINKKHMLAMSGTDWSILTKHDVNHVNEAAQNIDLEFKTDAAQEYDKLMEDAMKLGGGETVVIKAKTADDARAQLLIDVFDI